MTKKITKLAKEGCLKSSDLVKDYETGELLLKSEAFEITVNREKVFSKQNNYDTARQDYYGSLYDQDIWAGKYIYYKNGFEVNKDGKLIAEVKLAEANTKISDLQRDYNKQEVVCVFSIIANAFLVVFTAYLLLYIFF